MNELFMPIGLIVLAYLLGSISAAIITCKAMRLKDPRIVGSNNPGATNVKRIGGNKAAAITLLGDALKGLIAVLIVKAITDDILIISLVAVASFLGHLYPVFFQFKGGKGVATAFGALLGLSWITGVAAIATWLLVALGLKLSSFAALVAFALLPIYMHFIEGNQIMTIATVFISVLLFWRHRENIKRIVEGTEG
jgi:glycerol-3-phosphate acyltransferase PlsY